MGFYSWKYCDCPKERMICGMSRESYLLIPKEYGGGHIVEPCYNGYGKMGSMDIYELVADWNRNYVSDSFFVIPKRQEFDNGRRGQDFYERAMQRHEIKCNRLKDFNSENGISGVYMSQRYGIDWKREIGIDLACYDDENMRLVFPIKIAAKKTSVYEECMLSLKDPLQGCY